MISSLERARQDWLKEEKLFEEYGEVIKHELISDFSMHLIPAKITSRVKKVDSLLKKMLAKNRAYNEITDKVGVRVVVHFYCDLERADKRIQEKYGERIKKREDKRDSNNENTFGYSAIHYDLMSSGQGMELIAEVQLRTTCQDAWSELSHILSYKPERALPVKLKREVNALSALMEIADNQFQKIYDMVESLPGSSPTRILKEIKGFFLTNLADWYDEGMSYRFLENVIELYDTEEDILKILRDFISLRGEAISQKAKERTDILFFSQPEIIVILERLENKQHLLEHYWEQRFPVDQLENIANAWGKSLD